VRNRRDHLIAAGVLAAVAVVCALLSSNAVFRIFFGWPDGGTWSNTIAAIEDGLAFSFCMWYWRDHVGPPLIGWFARHHQPHADAHHQATRDHTASELLSLEQRLTGRLDVIEQLIRDAGGN